MSAFGGMFFFAISENTIGISSLLYICPLRWKEKKLTQAANGALLSNHSTLKKGC
jgi:hypothetical protein